MKLEYSAKVEAGKVIIQNRKQLDKDLKFFEGKSMTITIEKKRSKRSSPQNRYYWGVVIPIFREGLIDAGWNRFNCSKEKVHEMLKEKFLPKNEIVNQVTGEIIEMPASTSEQTKSEMIEYIDDIIRFSAEFLNVQIPLPNEVLEIDFN